MCECGYVTALWTDRRGWPVHQQPTPARGHHVKKKATKFRNRQSEAALGFGVSSHSCLASLTLGSCPLISPWWMIQQLWPSRTILVPRPAARVYFLFAKGPWREVDLVAASHGWLRQLWWWCEGWGRWKTSPTSWMRNKACGELRKGGGVEVGKFLFWMCVFGF